MTNADKYLKEGISAEEFVEAIEKEYPYDIEIGFGDIQEFLNAPAKPTLTEDERVVLRNIKNEEYKNTIGREGDTTYQKGKLYLRSKYSEAKAFAISTLYNHLFQFIEERRRI